MSVKVDSKSVIARLSEINDATRESLFQATQKATNNLLNLSKRAAPRDTGELRRKHTSSVRINGNTIEGRVETYSEHAVYVHEGTGIYAKNGNGRKTPWRYTVTTNRSKYKGEHWTRGNKPNPWMEKTILDNKDNVIRMFSRVLRGGYKKK